MLNQLIDKIVTVLKVLIYILMIPSVICLLNTAI